MKIYVMFPECMWNTMREKLLEAAIEEAFEDAHVENSHFHRRDGLQDKFDAICDCSALVIHPYFAGDLDKDMRYAREVFLALSRVIFFIEGTTLVIQNPQPQPT